MTILQKNTRMSQSLLWELQTAAYSRFGPQAWSKKGVPTYLTSNPYIAKKFAHVVLGFIRDTIDLSQPLYIFDLGAGSGRFAYLFIKNFLSMVDGVLLKTLKLRYIMTDIAESNIQFWQEHTLLKPFVESEILDFAYYHHAETDKPLRLLHSGEILDKESFQNPIVIVCTYYFDTIPQDLFRIKDGKLYEGHITLSVDKKNIDSADPSIIQQLKCQYDYVPIDKPEQYYPDFPQLNDILKTYLEIIDRVTFLFPIGGFQSLRYFADLCNGRLLLLAGDQGMSNEKQVRQWGEPEISLHATFSYPVNYHALGMYFQNQRGVALLTSFPESTFAVMVGVLGGQHFPETRLAFREHLDSFEPKDYLSLVNKVRKPLTLEYILLLLKLGFWDPNNFYYFYNDIRKQIPKASDTLQEHLSLGIHQTWEQFYPVCPEDGDFVSNLGVLLFEMKRYKEALVYFQRSLEITGEKTTTYQNMAQCYKALDDPEEATRCIQKASALHRPS